MYRDYIAQYLKEVQDIATRVDQSSVEGVVGVLAAVREKRGRLFIIGVGGGAGNASHAVCDFRKLAGIEAYAPSDNVTELTARVNDDGWHTTFSNWLKGSFLRADDAVMVFSVGGGSTEKNISQNLVEALKYAQSVGARIVGIVGRDGGYTRQVADACVIIPPVNAANVTPHTESFQAVVWHLIVSHPKFRVQEGKWESTVK